MLNMDYYFNEGSRGGAGSGGMKEREHGRVWSNGLCTGTDHCFNDS